ncbi:hypothetical protein [Pedobacter sp. GR22-6]|uniref:hypothetical protein n=1 Tax=Pedobacter sp. GR22-6 TaxID=3127957 RepID=UPI00307D6E2A
MKKTLLLLLFAALMGSCKEENQDCENKICTEVFTSVTIQFVDNKGEAAELKSYSVVNERTGEVLKSSLSATVNLIKGTYIVADDGHLLNLSNDGDQLKVTGTSMETNQTKSASVKIRGGKCACHIEKVSGASQIQFD